jgi:hypothetical protein
MGGGGGPGGGASFPSFFPLRLSVSPRPPPPSPGSTVAHGISTPGRKLCWPAPYPPGEKSVGGGERIEREGCNAAEVTQRAAV